MRGIQILLDDQVLSLAPVSSVPAFQKLCQALHLEHRWDDSERILYITAPSPAPTEQDPIHLAFAEDEVRIVLDPDPTVPLPEPPALLAPTPEPEPAPETAAEPEPALVPEAVLEPEPATLPPSFPLTPYAATPRPARATLISTPRLDPRHVPGVSSGDSLFSFQRSLSLTTETTQPEYPAPNPPERRPPAHPLPPATASRPSKAITRIIT